MTRVLVAEDSATAREYLVGLLAEEPDLLVVGAARDGVEAVERVEQLRPDVIVMDIYMPRMDGYEATRQIMERAPTPIVIVSASIRREEVGATFQALSAGALIALEKPWGPGHPRQEESARQLIDAVKLMAEVKVVRRWRRDRPRAPLTPRARRHAVRAVAIGASTGGPQVIAQILRELSPSLGAPVLVVQHIAPGFSEGLVQWFSQASALAVKLAEPDEPAQPGAVYVAPNGLHMRVGGDGRIRLAQEPAPDGFCPSITTLFESVADAYGPSALGVLLSGMGRDGVAGLSRIRAAGGATIVQDEDSCVVFGMPAEAIRAGAAEQVLSPDEIPRAICSLAAGGK